MCKIFSALGSAINNKVVDWTGYVLRCLIEKLFLHAIKVRQGLEMKLQRIK